MNERASKMKFKNPIIKGYYADPDVAVFDGKIYIYPTTDGNNWESSSFKAFSSVDMENWTDEGIILDLNDVEWTEGKYAWAPAICEYNGKYYFYYSGNKNIGVAVSDSPAGPFIDTGKPIAAKEDYDFQVIDPDVFIDDDNQPYLYFGNSKMLVAKLNDDMVSFATKPVDITPPNYSEGTCVFKRNGIYYFTWCCDDTCSPNYHVRYGKSESPLEKPVGDEIILHRDFAEDKTIKCTGHHTILNIPGTDEWYIIYHRFCAKDYGHTEDFNFEAGSHRELCIDRMYFDEEGNILPIKPTN